MKKLEKFEEEEEEDEEYTARDADDDYLSSDYETSSEEEGEKESQNYGLFEHRGAPEPARPAGRCRIARPLARLDLFAHPRGAGIRGRAG